MSPIAGPTLPVRGLSAVGSRWYRRQAVTERELEEYRALRATIRERGSQRLWLIWLGVAVWGALVTASMSLALWPIATLLPLIVLAVTFETVFAIHTAVERVGRYLQVFY